MATARIIDLLPKKLKGVLEKTNLDNVTLADFNRMTRQLTQFREKDSQGFFAKTHFKAIGGLIPHPSQGKYAASLKESEEVGKIVDILPLDLQEPLNTPRLQNITFHDYLLLDQLLESTMRGDPKLKILARGLVVTK